MSFCWGSRTWIVSPGSPLGVHRVTKMQIAGGCLAAEVEKGEKDGQGR
jgi:hypothetical protein